MDLLDLPSIVVRGTSSKEEHSGYLGKAADQKEVTPKRGGALLPSLYQLCSGSWERPSLGAGLLTPLQAGCCGIRGVG